MSAFFGGMTMWSYIVFATRSRHSGVATFLTKLRRQGIVYDAEYGIRRMRDGNSVIMAKLTVDQYDTVDQWSNVLRITALDPFEPPNDPLSGCDEEDEDADD